MNTKLQKILENFTPHFHEWIATINEYNSRFNPDKNLSPEEQTDLTYKTVGVLIKISEIYFKYGTFKDKFDNSRMYLNVYGPNLIIKSTKTKNTFHLGIDNKGIYLNTYLRHTENLRHMSDSFYKDVLTISNLGEFDIYQDQLYSGETTEKYSSLGLYNNHKSLIFKLIRNYIVGIAEDENDILLGNFHIHWTYSTDFHDIVHNGCLAFKILYRLNYSLWKIHDLESKKQNRATNEIK